MPLSKNSSIAAAIAFGVLGIGSIVGGCFLKAALESKYSVNLADEEQKVLIVGVPKAVDGHSVSLIVRITPVGLSPVEKDLAPADFDYDTGNQQDAETVWKDLTKWASSVTGGIRLDSWAKAGGVLDFQSFCGSVASVRKEATYGGGCYFVSSPAQDGSASVQYQPAVLQIPEEDIS